MQPNYRRLVQTHKDRLYSLAVRLLGERSAAEDVVQDTFIKLWQHLESLEAERVMPWLLRVTRNACLDQLRRAKHRNTWLAVGGGEIEGITETVPEHDLERSELKDALNEAVADLKEPYRSLILLRDVQGHSYRDVGQTLDLSESQVKVYLHRARRMLRHQLREQADG